MAAVTYTLTVYYKNSTDAVSNTTISLSGANLSDAELALASAKDVVRTKMSEYYKKGIYIDGGSDAITYITPRSIIIITSVKV
jgi:hypothetical protein